MFQIQISRWYLSWGSRPYKNFGLNNSRSILKDKSWKSRSCLDIYWALQRHKWPQTKMYTNSLWLVLFGALDHETTFSLVKNLKQPSISRFKELTLWKKRITLCVEEKNVPKNGVGDCVHFCLRPLVLLERCARIFPNVQYYVYFPKEVRSFESQVY